MFGGRSAGPRFSLSIPLDQLISRVGPISKRDSIIREIANNATSTRNAHSVNPETISMVMNPTRYFVQPVMPRSDEEIPLHNDGWH